MLWHFLGHTLGDKPQHELESMDAPGLHGTQTEEFLECPDKATAPLLMSDWVSETCRICGRVNRAKLKKKRGHLKRAQQPSGIPRLAAFKLFFQVVFDR
ncbi:uncharacterized [Tachysurus ichikawai]